ncbi:hypothetical protein ACIREE_33440 [Streptomyces sp. NPDC102467]|uniref:hypothetical protein n=1 Tax=Streptomyces sp. NPDC102467 TaxID=3366179 RepID=UPI0038290109
MATIVAIRAAQGGSGNVTGLDLRGLRLSDPRGTLDALRGLGWDVADELLDPDFEAPVAVAVPDLVAREGKPLPFGKLTRSRVSGWVTKTLAAKPLKKASVEARWAALFMAAHSSPRTGGELPGEMPAACRDAVPELVARGFLTQVTKVRQTTQAMQATQATSIDGEHFMLAPAVAHLSGMVPETPDGVAAEEDAAARSLDFDPAAWEAWKLKASPALLRHVQSVETCTRCARTVEDVAAAFTVPAQWRPVPRRQRTAYGEWKDAHPDRGPEAARFTLSFRAQHGHGPSYTQLSEGLGWDLARPLKGFVVQRLIANEWLTTTGTVPWTLRPGAAAQEAGIVLPRSAPSPASPVSPALPAS